MSEKSHLTKNERNEIYLLKKQGYSYRKIAEVLERNVSTISKEIRRNSVRQKGSKEKIYKPKSAEIKSYYRRKYAKKVLKKIIDNPELREYIEESLKKYWSPEQVAETWNMKNQKTHISYVTIYKYIHSVRGQKFAEYLYSKRLKPRKRRKKKGQRSIIPYRTWIEERPKYINKRKFIGDFEGDLIVSKKGDRTVLLTMIERKSRLLIVKKLKNKKPKNIERQIKAIKKKVKINSLTLDNGIEFRNHYKLGIPTYFCHPYSSWEKGQIEYANKLIRRFIPKKKNISDYSNHYIQKIVRIINNTPRKCLNFLTPIEVFNKYSHHKIK